MFRHFDVNQKEEKDTLLATLTAAFKSARNQAYLLSPSHNASPTIIFGAEISKTMKRRSSVDFTPQIGSVPENMKHCFEEELCLSSKESWTTVWTAQDAECTKRSKNIQLSEDCDEDLGISCNFTPGADYVAGYRTSLNTQKVHVANETCLSFSEGESENSNLVAFSTIPSLFESSVCCGIIKDPTSETGTSPHKVKNLRLDERKPSRSTMDHDFNATNMGQDDLDSLLLDPISCEHEDYASDDRHLNSCGIRRHSEMFSDEDLLKDCVLALQFAEV
jgi:hypothetical protein